MNIEQLIEKHAQAMAEQMPQIAASAESEEDVRLEVTKLIDEFITKAGIKVRGRHEYGLAGGQVDSKYGGVIIEYKNPHGPDRITEDAEAPGTRKVVEQIQKRFRDFQKQEDIDPSRIFGVGCDGDTLIFVRHRGGKFELENPQPVTAHTVERLLRALVSLGARGMSFTPGHLATTFGADNNLAQEGLRDIYAVITETDDPKALTFFKQWKIQFSEVCGYDVEGHNPKIEKLGEHYGVPNANPAALLFSLHTYYAIFMKFLAAEIVSSFSPLGLSVIKRCVEAPTDAALLAEMQNLEQGGIWTQLGVANFLEGDLFSWYISAWHGRIAGMARKLVEKLDQFDPTTLSVEPAESRDLLKKLYQNLFPKSVRHDLGEYYTPDWLAEHVLNELGYEGDPDKRLLDPACGSGTFLVIAINRIKSWFAEHRDQCGYREDELLQKILHNVIGFDLNPLAVMAARTNYLMAIRDMFQFAGQVELPVYMCDSIMTPAEYGGLLAGERADRRVLHTAAGDFDIPTEITTDRQQLAAYADALEFCVRDRRYDTDEFLTYCENQGLPVAAAGLHRALYEKLSKLDADNENGIWARIIKNAFAPLFIEPVDYVAGNPPWVNWESLPEEYRQSTAPLWQTYELFPHKGYKAKLGGGKDDISILMTYVAHDCYLVEGGRLGFLITQSVFKTKGGGEGFRSLQYQSNHTTYFLRPLAVHDLSQLQVFEGATNRTAVFVCEKATERFAYPVDYVVWRGPSRLSPDETLEQVLSQTSRHTVGALPVEPGNMPSPWLTAPQSALPGITKVIGQSDYAAHEGVNSGGLNGCYWVRIIKELPNGDLLIENIADVGKKKVPRVQAAVEPDLVYPLLRGRDVKRWHAEPAAHIILANRTDKLAGIPEAEMKQKYPKTFAYLMQFEEQLRQRSGYRRYFKPTDPFYSMYNVGPYTLAPWKVVWRYIASKFTCSVLCHREPLVIPDHRLISISLDDDIEAYYLAALLNSGPIALFVHSYTIGTQMAPYLLANMDVPKFDPTNELHQSLSSLSCRCHEADAQGDTDTVAALEAEIDQAAAKLWDITDDELKAIQDVLAEM